MKFFFRIILILLLPVLANAQSIPPEVSPPVPPSDAEILRMMTPQSESYLLTATATQARAMRLNPASVGAYAPVNIAYDAHIEDGRIYEHEILFQNYLFNFAWRRALSNQMNYRVDQISMSMGFSQPQVNGGFGFNYITTDLPDSKSKLMWNLSMMLIPDRYSQVVITKRNINPATFAGVELRGVQSIGIGVWPFWDRDQLSIGVDYTWPNRVRMVDGGTKFGAEAKLLDFVRIYALYEFTPIYHEQVGMIGIRVFVPYASVNVGNSFDSFRNYMSTEASVLVAPEQNTLK